MQHDQIKIVMIRQPSIRLDILWQNLHTTGVLDGFLDVGIHAHAVLKPALMHAQEQLPTAAPYIQYPRLLVGTGFAHPLQIINRPRKRVGHEPNQIAPTQSVGNAPTVEKPDEPARCEPIETLEGVILAGVIAAHITGIFLYLQASTGAAYHVGESFPGALLFFAQFQLAVALGISANPAYRHVC